MIAAGLSLTHPTAAERLAGQGSHETEKAVIKPG